MRLAPADIGMTGRPSVGPAAGWSAAAVVAAILDTTRSDAMTDDTTSTTARLLTGPELTAAVQPWLHLPDTELPTPTRPGRLGMSDVLRIRDTTDAFRRLDNAHGGGLSRRAVVGQLQDITTMVKQGRASDEVGRELFVAVADLASVAGWMTHDVGRHAEAQHYLLLGLQAAKAAGPAGAAIAGHLLNCLARQANHLRRPTDALELVQAGMYGTRKLPADRLRAVLAILEARCHATLGDLPAAQRSIATAEHALDNDTEPPTWVLWFDRAEYEVTVGVCELIAAEHDADRARNAITSIEAGTALRPAERTRSRAFDQIALARAYVRSGDLDGADTATYNALHLFGHVDSTRITDRLRELDAELAAVPGAPLARTTRERIAAATA
ncbi:transcriptional regulator [Streptomyces sp. BE303]|uniref:transcriptional regulator n=1 Tax=Streptomyces sp. BE303 TaxID=3002528 RepID=UPI002E77B3E1|nr:transcriptional regulator [Streptomyces sp. BE303]MED7947343.1 transcriptional regulator [Streptomyces sp. BE303]